MKISIVIRTLNEEKYLEELLNMCNCQSLENEVVVVDSGSADNTLSIADQYGAKVVKIEKKDFTFGKSLNLGIESSTGDIIAIISGHCVPKSTDWLKLLVKPIVENHAVFSYGKQLGRDTTKYSEEQHFSLFFGDKDQIPQNSDFVNNANSAVLKSIWQLYKFNETLTGLEDIDFAKRCRRDNHEVAYVSDASVYHIHNENFRQIKRRYEREAYALVQINPEIRFTIFDLVKFTFASIVSDIKSSIREKVFLKHCISIISFRFLQYYGSYIGANINKALSDKKKEAYFFPKNK